MVLEGLDTKCLWALEEMVLDGTGAWEQESGNSKIMRFCG